MLLVTELTLATEGHTVMLYRTLMRFDFPQPVGPSNTTLKALVASRSERTVVAALYLMNPVMSVYRVFMTTWGLSSTRRVLISPGGVPPMKG